MADPSKYISIGLLVLALDFGAWIQACITAGYFANKKEYNWTKAVPLGYRWNKTVARYVPLTGSGILLSFSTGSEDQFGVFLIGACVLLVIYVSISARLFYSTLKEHIEDSGQSEKP